MYGPWALFVEDIVRSSPPPASCAPEGMMMVMEGEGGVTRVNGMRLMQWLSCRPSRPLFHGRAALTFGSMSYLAPLCDVVDCPAHSRD